MNVLILTCSTGGGHNACAAALREELEAMGDTCRVEDCLGFLSGRASAFAGWGHRTVYRRLPWLFRWGYGYADKHPEAFRTGGTVFEFLRRGTAGLEAFLAREAWDAVICVHVFASMMLCALRENGGKVPYTVFTATDYSCSPGAAESGADLYCIPHESLGKAFWAKGVPADRIAVTGIPVRKMFLEEIPPREAKRSRGIPEEKKHLVLMGGSMGAGPIKGIFDRLCRESAPGFEITVVCGSNEPLRKRLQRKAGHREDVHILGCEADMNGLLSSADLLVTKPGGISVTEAWRKAVPMVLADTVSGCEGDNLRFLAERFGTPYGRDAKALAESCRSMMEQDERRLWIRAKLSGADRPGTAEALCLLLHKRIGTEGRENR